MSVWQLANFVESTLSQAILAADTAVYIDPDDVAGFPTLDVGEKVKGVIFNSTYREIVNVTAWTVAGDLTVQRAQEGTTARDWAAGTRFVHTPTAEVLQEVLDAVQGGRYTGVATGTDSITVTTEGSVPTLADSDEITFEVANTNTGPVTLSRTNGTTTIGPFAVVKEDRSALTAGELVAGYRASVQYDASSGHLVLMNQGSKRYHVTHINTGPLDAGNQLPNGSFDAWNNATSFATPASGTETADNVVVTYDGSIGTFTISRQAFTLGQTNVPGGPKYFLRWDHTSAGSASTFRKLRMRIPRVGKFDLESVIASIFMKADSARNVTAKLIQSFGTGGSPSAEVTLTTETWALSTSWTQFDLASAVTSIAGKTLGSNGDDGLILELAMPVNVTMTIEAAMGQFELGTVASKTHSRLPWSLEFGGTGGFYTSQLQLATDLSVSAGTWLTQAAFNSGNPDLASIEALAGTSGILVRTAASTHALRQVVAPTGMGVTNPAGVAGDITLTLGTALTNYVADPMSAAELASVTAAFGTAAFVADSGLVHITGVETITGNKSLTGSTTLSAVTITGDVAMTTGTDQYVYYEGNLHIALSGTGTAIEFLGTSRDMVFYGKALGIAGSVGAPTYSFNSDPDTGWWNSAANTLQGVAGGAAQLTLALDAVVLENSAILYANAGSAGTPGITFRLDTNTGFLNPASDAIGVSLGGTQYVYFSAAVTQYSHDVTVDAIRAPTSNLSLGYRGCPVISGNSAYAFPASDAGCAIYHDEAGARTYTIPANSSVAHPIGTVFVIDNTGNAGAAGAITLNITTDTLRRGDGTAGTGSRTIPASAVAVIRKVAATVWVITGAFT